MKILVKKKLMIKKLSLLVKNVRRMFYKIGKFNNYRKERRQGKDERKCNEIRSCYNCKKPRQLIADVTFRPLGC